MIVNDNSKWMRFEQSDLGKKTNDNTFYQNAIHYKERENALFEKNYKSGIFSLSFVINLGGGMIEIFSVGMQKRDKG